MTDGDFKHPSCSSPMLWKITCLNHCPFPHLSQLFFTVEIFRAATESRVACFQHGKMTDDMNMRKNFRSSSGYETPSKKPKSWQEPWKYEILVGEMQDPWSFACFFTPFYALPEIPIRTSEIFFGIPYNQKPEGWSLQARSIIRFFMGPGLRVFFQKVTNFQFRGVILPILHQIKCIFFEGYPWVVRSTGWSWMTVQRLEIGLWNYWCKNPAKQLRLGSLSHYPKVLYIPTVFPFTGSVEGDKTGTPERY